MGAQRRRIWESLPCLVAAVGLMACEAPQRSQPNQCSEVGQACPDTEKPYLFPGCPACVELIEVPRITATRIDPFGGRVPIAIEFCADVAVQFPEQIEGLTLQWDVDGVAGVDIEVDADTCFEFTYTECNDVFVSVTPVDNVFGLAGTSVTRLIRNSCNQPPICADLQITLDNGGFANGEPPLNVQAFVTVFDPDFLDPDLDSANGIVSFEVDWEGDGRFDVSRPGNLQVLPLTHIYNVAGVYRPRLRAFDERGLSCEVQKGKVTVFAPITVRDDLYVHGAVNSVVVPDPSDPVTNVVLAWAEAGYAWLRQRAAGLPLRVEANDQVETASLVDLARVGGTLVAAQEGARLALFALDSGAGIDPGTPVRRECAHTVADALEVTATSFVTDTVHWRVVARTGSGVWAYNADAWSAAPLPTVCDQTTLPRNPDEGAAQTLEAVPFGASAFTPGPVAALDRYAFVAASGSNGVTAVVAYDLSDTTPTSVCAVTSAGCLMTSAAVRALATLAGGRGVVAANRAGDPGTYTTFALARPVDTAAAATLWVDGAGAYAPASNTWWFVSPLTLAVLDAGSVALTAAAALTLDAAREPLIAVGLDGGRIDVYALDLTAVPTYTWRSGGCCATAVDGLALDPQGLVLWWDRTSAYLTPGATPADRQRRGLYAAPLTEPARWLYLPPPRMERRDRSAYPGPLAAARDRHGWWVADGDWGVYYVTPPAPGSAYASAPATSSAYAIAEREVDLSAAPTQLLARADTQRVYVALGEAGVASVDFRDFNAPRLDWLLTTRDTVTGLSLLQDDAGNLLSLTGSDRVVLLDLAQPERIHSTYVVATGDAVLHAELYPDPEPGARGLLLTYEQTDSDSGDTVYRTRLRGFDSAADLSAVPPRQLVLPDDTGGFVFSTPIPPVVGRLVPGGEERPRTLFREGTLDRLCIEPYWVGTCSAPAFQGGFLGTPFRVINDLNEPLIAFFDGLTQKFTLTNQDGGIVNPGYSLCGDLPTQDEELGCFSGSDFNAMSAANSFWVLSTEYALYVVDLRNVVTPQLLTRSKANYGLIAAWPSAPHVRVAHVMSDAARIRVLTADSLLADP